jgi:hypothetical protein
MHWRNMVSIAHYQNENVPAQGRAFHALYALFSY